MNAVSRIVWCILFSFIITCYSALAARSDVRKFAFEDSYSTGKLSLLKVVGNDAIAIPTAVARGKVTVSVPAGQKLILELNPHCLEHPE